MKKHALLLLAGGLLTFAACTNEQATTGGYTTEQFDSAVDARLNELRAQLVASNDSMINALAQWKADSMIAAAKGTAPSSPKPPRSNSGNTTQTPPVTPAPAPPTQPTATGKNDQAQKQGEATGKNDQAQKQGEATGKRR
jgi:hypothetical protein